MAYKSEYPGIIHFEQKGHVVYLTFDNPARLNALNMDMFHSINEIFDEMEDDEDVWGVVLTGAGRSFISGADLKGDDLIKAETAPCLLDKRKRKMFIHRSLARIANFPRPTIAAINGYALGGGAELALNCDFRIVSTKAKIGFPESKLGNIPGYTGPSRAVKIMGVTSAKEMIFTGAMYSAEEAKDLGFCRIVCEPEELMPTVDKFMGTLMERAPLALKFGKLMCDRATEMSMESPLEYERLVQMLLTATEDNKEGFAAFREKRPPHFINR